MCGTINTWPFRTLGYGQQWGLPEQLKTSFLYQKVSSTSSTDVSVNEDTLRTYGQQTVKPKKKKVQSCHKLGDPPSSHISMGCFCCPSSPASLPHAHAPPSMSKILKAIRKQKANLRVLQIHSFLSHVFWLKNCLKIGGYVGVSENRLNP